MDKTLDEIISKSKTTRRRPAASRRGSARAQVLGKPAPNPTQRARAAPAAVDPVKAVAQGSEKIIVSNLPSDVNEAQIKDLFTQTVGPLREITLHYDANGRSKGIANVTFQKKGDGTKAFQQYNNRLIDGS
ncbi:hypothetical protein D9613_009917 [Agrocybe pediades]|uniref:RRM domain-containing protein n=1 Tax=Agrocybe pediades TaxID=84607 RepID=A0A8H4QWZ3_9AGAR|nr:hypothetical protein D9613_009917 [Agrocybe pediades]